MLNPRTVLPESCETTFFRSSTSSAYRLEWNWYSIAFSSASELPLKLPITPTECGTGRSILRPQNPLCPRCTIAVIHCVKYSCTSRGGGMAYALDLKSKGPQGPCGFESRPRHQSTCLRAKTQLRTLSGGHFTIAPTEIPGVVTALNIFASASTRSEITCSRFLTSSEYLPAWNSANFYPPAPTLMGWRG